VPAQEENVFYKVEKICEMDVRNEIRAVFFDIDGTLVPFGEHSIPDSTRESLDRLRARGIKIFIATGRHPVWIDNLGDAVFDGYVTTNGALCLAGDMRTEIYRRTIDDADKKRLVEFCRRNDMPFVIVPADGKIFATGINDNLRDAARLLNIPSIPREPVETCLGCPVVQMMVFEYQDVIARSGLFDDVLLRCHQTSWCPWFADILPAGSDKSVGIDRIIEYYGIPLASVMAFGDGSNDVGMLRHVGVGVAMGNAAEAVRDAADYVTAPVDKAGVSAALRHFGLI